MSSNSYRGGAILGVIEGKFANIATPVFIMPEIVSQLATHKTTAKWLSTGFDLPAHSPEGAALASRLLGAVRRIQSNIARKKGNQGRQTTFPRREFRGYGGRGR